MLQFIFKSCYTLTVFGVYENVFWEPRESRCTQEYW